VKPSPLLVLLLLVIAYGCALCVRYMPVQIFARTQSLRPMQHSRAQTYRYARTILASLGGLPPDAVAEGYNETVQGAGSPARRIGDFYRWHHRDLLASLDFILAEIKERPDGTMYPYAVVRTWHPLWMIRLTQWMLRQRAKPLPPFSALTSSCAHGVDPLAVSRVLASGLTYLPVSSERTPPPLASRPAASVAWRDATTLGVSDRGFTETFPMLARAAWVSDGPPGEHYRIVEVYSRFFGAVTPYAKHWHWRTFGSADIERVCTAHA